jgi:hypothetical protein
VIDGLVTGTVTSTARRMSGEGDQERLKITVTTGDDWGRKVNVVCSSNNLRVTETMRALQMGDVAAVRGRFGAVVVVRPGQRDESQVGVMKVRAFEVIKLN